MFPLWRKRLALALFPNQVLRGDGGEPVTLQAEQQGRDALLAAFSDVLQDAKRTSRRKIRLSLAVSDSFAAIVALPWQSALSRASEIDAYAHAQFERACQPLDERWVMFSYFRYFGATGLAYALPKDFVQGLSDTAASHDVVIDSILPLSALVYASQTRSRDATTALVLCEAGRVSAFVAGKCGLMTYATEAVAGANERAVERLLRRLQIEHELQAIEGCALEPDLEADLSTLVSRVLPSARCTVASANFWKR